MLENSSISQIHFFSINLFPSIIFHCDNIANVCF